MDLFLLSSFVWLLPLGVAVYSSGFRSLGLPLSKVVINRNRTKSFAKDAQLFKDFYEKNLATYIIVFQKTQVRTSMKIIFIFFNYCLYFSCYQFFFALKYTTVGKWSDGGIGSVISLSCLNSKKIDSIKTKSLNFCLCHCGSEKILVL
ncbi:hypothetical protein BpHYR1_021949 [Brachionus plicatilis]|uniref:Uncharacterized protein n=1 Tax=Brachionus plicatilis TaxID=10195 RepID=A0A3M7Q0F7_BRAPC|nr:hypothetical protein BpHYR1_021949 [Brachionus plicatilis]